MEIITDLRNAVLHKKCEEVKDFNLSLITFMNKLTGVMIKKVGLGLSAPQVGMPIRAFVMYRSNDEILKVVNPVIVERGKLVDSKNESCLSIPNFNKSIKRSKRIKVEFRDHTGVKKKIELKGLDSFIFQHELNHLNGVMIND